MAPRGLEATAALGTGMRQGGAGGPAAVSGSPVRFPGALTLAAAGTLRDAAELPTLRAEATVMGMPDLLTPTYWTAEMVRALPEDGQVYELFRSL